MIKEKKNLNYNNNNNSKLSEKDLQELKKAKLI
jgi:hypothetical protein